MGTKLLAAAAVVWALIGAQAQAQTQAAPPAAAMATEAQVRELLQITKSDQQLKQIMPQLIDQIMGAIVQKLPGLPDAVREDTITAMKQVFVEGAGLFVEATIPIYQRNLTGEEIVAITAFVKTPAGKAFIEKTPKLMLEAMQMGQQVGQLLGQKAAQAAIKVLQEKGYKI
jgi:hypothetical protein